MWYEIHATARKVEITKSSLQRMLPVTGVFISFYFHVEWFKTNPRNNFMNIHKNSIDTTYYLHFCQKGWCTNSITKIQGTLFKKHWFVSIMVSVGYSTKKMFVYNPQQLKYQIQATSDYTQLPLIYSHIYIYIIPVQSSINWESWTLTCAELVPPMEDSEVWVGGIQWVSHWDFFLQPSIQRKSPIIYIIKINHHQITACDTTYSTSTAQGGGGSFKHRKPIGEVGCCESQMAERIHSWTKKLTKLCFQEWLQWLQSPPHHCWM